MTVLPSRCERAGSQISEVDAQSKLVLVFSFFGHATVCCAMNLPGYMHKSFQCFLLLNIFSSLCWLFSIKSAYRSLWYAMEYNSTKDPRWEVDKNKCLHKDRHLKIFHLYLSCSTWEAKHKARPSLHCLAYYFLTPPVCWNAGSHSSLLLWNAQLYGNAQQSGVSIMRFVLVVGERMTSKHAGSYLK